MRNPRREKGVKAVVQQYNLISYYGFLDTRQLTVYVQLCGERQTTDGARSSRIRI